MTITPLSPATQQNMISSGIWKPWCPVPLDRLRVVQFPYFDYDGQEHHEGCMVVLDAVAEAVFEIFTQLHVQRFPIHQACPIEFYHGSDEASMADNNSSAFNCRTVANSDLLSLHAYGVAIDINPLHNPFITYDDTGHITNIFPPEGKPFMDRTLPQKGYVEPIVELFKSKGFTIWGGEWNKPKDWHHFQPPRAVAVMLAAMEPQDAADYFKLYAHYAGQYNLHTHLSHDFLPIYQKDPKKFIALLLDRPEAVTFTPEKMIQYI